MRRYPVIIVGAGPAGSSCAKALADGGISSLVIEKRGLPRHKTCSGVIMCQCRELLERYFGKLPPAETRCEPEYIDPDSALECLPDGSQVKYVWELPKDGKPLVGPWINIRRDRFDHWLLRESGAEVMERTLFLGFRPADGGLVVSVRRPGGGVEDLFCGYLVGAGGGTSVIRRMLDPDVDAGHVRRMVATYAYYEYRDAGRLRRDRWYVFLDRAFGDVISCVHHKDDLLALSVGGFVGADLLALERRFMKHLTAAFGTDFGGLRLRTGCHVRIGSPFMGRENVLLAGGAAGMSYLNGEGLAAVIDSGYRAGQTIAGSMARGKGDCAADYAAACTDILRHMEVCAKHMRCVVPR